VTTRVDAKAWWRFAIKAFLSEIAWKNRTWTWEYFQHRRNDRRVYISLWKEAKLNGDRQAARTIDDLDRVLSLHDILLYRALASREFDLEHPDFVVKSFWSPRTWLRRNTSQLPEEERWARVTPPANVAYQREEKEYLAMLMDFPNSCAPDQEEKSPEVSFFSSRNSFVSLSLSLSKVSFHPPCSPCSSNLRPSLLHWP